MKKNKEYFYTGLLTFIIISILYLNKGIFPFGSNSVIWSDMHEQVVSMYYHFYDAIYGNSSLLLSFTSGGTINFIGIIAYYIASPFTFLLLLFPRDLLSDATSIIVMLKMITASVTMHYFLSYYFKNLKIYEKSILSIIYALSSYVLTLYFITSWMDAVYLFPLLIIGLKKLLDGESPKMYLIILTIFMITTFYMSLILLLFIIFCSFVYLYIYRKGKDNKRIIFNLGISTIISMITSSIVLVPSLMEVSSSPKLGIALDNITNSKFGPLSDKISFFFSLGFVCALVILQLLKFKKDKKNNLFILVMILLLGLPVVIEPINKLWHYGNYVYLPYRYGYMITMLLVGVSAYYLNNYRKEKVKVLDGNKVIPLGLGILTVITTILVILKFRPEIIKVLDSLSLTSSKKITLILFGLFFLNFISIFSTMYLCNYKDKFTKIIVYSLVFVNIFFNSSLFIGTFDSDGKLELQYNEMMEMYDSKNIDDKFYTIDKDKNLIMNFGDVTKVRTYNNFTSLINDTNFRTLQNLGYDALWIDTSNLGGNIFTNMILGNKYLFTNKEFNDSLYEKIYSDKYFDYYAINKDMPYGYFINKDYSLDNVNNSFEASNLISNSIIHKDIFIIDDIFKSEKDISSYDKDDIFEVSYDINEKERIYLEAFTDYYHTTKMKSYDAFKIYVNGNLIEEKYPNKKKNGVLYLGEFENEKVTIRIEKNNVKDKESIFRNVTVGRIKLSDIDYLLDNNKNNIDIKFNKNNINISINSDKDGIMMLPLVYLDGYKESNNNIVKVFDNFVGIKVSKGYNEFNISYFPKELKLSIILSIIGICLSIIYIKFISNKELPKFIYMITYFGYYVLSSILIFIFYILGPLFFVLSFIVK